MMSENFTIKQFSEMTNVSLHTLRYYERIGLIDPVNRADNGHRRYTQKDITRVEFLKRLRATGMPIREMQRYVRLYHEGDSTAIERREMLESHREVLQGQLNLLHETLTMIDGKIRNYYEQEAQAKGASK